LRKGRVFPKLAILSPPIYAPAKTRKCDLFWGKILTELFSSNDIMTSAKETETNKKGFVFPFYIFCKI
jgi:hypothetical protein